MKWDCLKPRDYSLFKNARDARRTKNESRGVYKNTLSGAVCSATRQMSVLQNLSAFTGKEYYYSSLHLLPERRPLLTVNKCLFYFTG